MTSPGVKTATLPPPGAILFFAFPFFLLPLPTGVRASSGSLQSAPLPPTCAASNKGSQAGFSTGAPVASHGLSGCCTCVKLAQP